MMPIAPLRLRAFALSPVTTRLLSVVLLLLAFALRVYRIGEQRVWWDEGWSVWVARFAPLEILRQTGHDVHPPLYFQLLHFWRLISGDSEAGLRLLSALLGTLAVALTYSLGRRMARGTLAHNPATAAGLLAALLLAVSRFAIAWSQEIRMYALATLLALLAVWAARQFWQRGRARDAALYVAATAAGLYTLYLFAPVWGAINLAWLVSLKERGSRGAGEQGRTHPPRPPAPLHPCIFCWLALQLAVLTLFAPWLWYAAGGFLSTASATPIGLLDFLHIYWTVLTVGIPVDVAQFNRLTLPALAVFVAAVGALVVKASAGGRRTTDDRQQITGGGRSDSPLLSRPPAPLQDLILLLSTLLLPALLVYLISLPKQNFYNPPFNPRYLVIFTPFYSILLAWGIVTIGTWMGRADRRPQTTDDKAGSSHTQTSVDGAAVSGQRSSVVRRLSSVVPVLLAAFMLAVALVGLWPYYPGRVLVDDYPSLVSTIDAYRQPDDAVVLYTDTDWPIFAYHHPQPWRGVPHLWTLAPESTADFLEPIWAAHEAIWLVTTPYSAGGDPQRHVPAWLTEQATAVREFTYKDMALTLYTRTAERAATADQVTGDTPANLNVPLPGGGTLTGYAQAARDFKSGDIIHLFFYRQGSEAGRTEVGLIDTASSNVWGTTTVEWPAASGTARQQVDILVPPEAPTGDYRFYVRDANGATVPFGRLTVRQRQSTLLTTDDVTIANPLSATFGNEGIRLLGYDLAQETVRPGETVDLTLYWTSDGATAQRYKVFTHVLGDTFNAGTGNFLWGQADNEPAANTRPTTTWRADEVIVDQYAIPIAADAPPGTYRIEIGLYDPLTGARLMTADGADHLILTEVNVE